jgi:hypothetical protein
MPHQRARKAHKRLGQTREQKKPAMFAGSFCRPKTAYFFFAAFFFPPPFRAPFFFFAAMVLVSMTSVERPSDPPVDRWATTER